MSDREFLEPDHDEEEYGEGHRVGHGPPSSNHALRKWGDEHQYDAAPMQAQYDERTGVLPKVHLVWMTPDPLGAIAAACRMYEGKPTYSLDDITEEERRHYWDQAQATHLKAPLEYVKFHFFIEGVDRAFTHQMVRQRTAVYAQESMRFAVMGGNFHENTSLPPSLHGTMTDPEYHPDGAPSTKPEQRWRDTWDEAIAAVERAYTSLVESGMPAEEARGLLPHAMATRLNYATDLRALLDHAGNRLCTQAQFHWRLVFAQMAKAIREYHEPDFDHPDTWQFQELSKVFRPVCYEQGKCPFKASFDRECSIRERVDANAALGRDSSEWHLPLHYENGVVVDAIHPGEWMMDPSAARRR
jgi:flavin-dependent thymidylate synthase